ncbi:MAG: Gfo/Idh/MocA family oxidoreductase [Chloroflexi bacterium]|nr:Gfo/Idh/MocA family oxidoreductase [Chloroflexota bacterium]MBV9898261.1 Gfo/Idh/MocA family oxidoreductase [Chloroflexota bacterium]
MQQRSLKIGIIGIGVGGAEILPAMESMETIHLVAGADVVPATLERFKERFPSARTYQSAEELCEDAEVEAVWVSSPNRFHAEHTILAARHGKHVVVEKPMAVTLEDAERMVEAADRYGVKLLAGHTRAFTVPIRAMRRVIESGKYGQLRALNIWSYSDWMLRPRTADELDLAQGGGIPYRQGPHQVDTVRLLGGGMLRSVRAQVGQWMAERPIPGFYSAFLEFENGVPATISHNGYGYFLGAELVPWGEDRQQYSAEERARIRGELRSGTRAEMAEKQAMRIGGSQQRVVFDRMKPKAWVPEDMGMAIASLDRADVRQSAYGLYIHSDDGKMEVDVEARSGGAVGRRAELEELYAAVVGGQPVWHDGRWGMATLEVCLAIMQSARERREVMLQHQVPVPAGYDADMPIPGEASAVLA